AHVTAMLVTAADPTVPVPPVTVQVCPVGCVAIVTAYAAPLASFVANVNVPSAATLTSSPPLSRSTTLPERPLTVPPIAYVVDTVVVVVGAGVGGGVAVDVAVALGVACGVSAGSVSPHAKRNPKKNQRTSKDMKRMRASCA